MLATPILERLEEAPLRLVETDSHGSPWHELVDSKSFNKALETVPGLLDKMSGKIDTIIKGRKVSSTAKQIAEEVVDE